MQVLQAAALPCQKYCFQGTSSAFLCTSPVRSTPRESMTWVVNWMLVISRGAAGSAGKCQPMLPRGVACSSYRCSSTDLEKPPY